MPVLRLIASANLPTWPALTFAAPPVDLMTCAVSAPTFCASRASLIAPLTKPTAAAAPPATANALPSEEPSLEPVFFVSGSTCLESFEPKPLALGRMLTKADPTSATSHLRVVVRHGQVVAERVQMGDDLAPRPTARVTDARHASRCRVRGIPRA